MLRTASSIAVLLTALLVSSAIGQPGDVAVVTFTLDFPGSEPEWYSVRIQSDGQSHYDAASKGSSEAEEADKFAYDFAISPAMRQKIFDLTAKAGYFGRDVEAHRKNMAFTGKKTLAYKDASRHSEATYNYSSDPTIQQLTNLFQSLGATLDYGFVLDYDHRYQKLALEKELKRLEEEINSGTVIELQAIAPILQKIVDDSAVINVTRGRAQRILGRGNGSTGR
jgi:hypothetical protein